MTSIEQMKETDPDPFVYITRTGKCYHEYNCGKLKYSRIRCRLSYVVSKGLRACPYCFSPDFNALGIVLCIVFSIIVITSIILI